jgi:uncharacterized membrane protein
MDLRLRGSANSLLKVRIMLLRLSNLPWFTWTVAALLPLGPIAYVLKFYRKHCRSLAVWRMASFLAFIQIALLLLSFAFIPTFAFLANVVALPFGYYLLDSSLKRLQITSNIDSAVLPRT